MKNYIFILLLLLVSCGGGSNSPEKLGSYENFQMGNMVNSSPPPTFEYAPTVMKDSDGTFKAWWCQRDEDGWGDAIYYAQSSISIHEGWSAPIKVLGGNGIPGRFDKDNICDPSVIKYNNIYYMYYGGLNMEKVVPDYKPQTKAVTEIGVATSSDGVHWAVRELPIVSPFRPNLPAQYPNDWLLSHYGAGQPSVFYKDDYFYMLFHDSTGITFEKGGMGLYVIRSKYPEFPEGSIEYLTQAGFMPKTQENYTTYVIKTGASADFMYSPDFNSYIMAFHGKDKRSAVIAYDENFAQYIRIEIKLPISWSEGPGVLRTEEGWLESKTYEFMFSSADGPDITYWNLYTAKVDLVGAVEESE